MFFIICCFGSLFSWLQAPLQAFLRPALWFPGLRAIHQKKERWELKEEPAMYFRKVCEALAVLQMRFYDIYGYKNVKVAKVDSENLFIQAHFLTPHMQWLDVVELQFIHGRHSGTEVKAHSFSTGLFPICIPFSFLINMVLFFMPFYDWGQNKKRLLLIREVAAIQPEIEYLSNC